MRGFHALTCTRCGGVVLPPQRRYCLSCTRAVKREREAARRAKLAGVEMPEAPEPEAVPDPASETVRRELAAFLGRHPEMRIYCGRWVPTAATDETDVRAEVAA